MIFGIILDTFAELRDKNAEKEENMNNYCFICSIHRDLIDSKIVGGFDFHQVRHGNVSYLRKKNTMSGNIFIS